jgi:hypothetical protein
VDATYIFLCRIMWRRYRDEEAGWDVANALGSKDLKVQLVARILWETL